MAVDSRGNDLHSESLEFPVEEPEPLRYCPVREAVDLSYRVVVRTVLWVIVGALVVGFVGWWAWT